MTNFSLLPSNITSKKLIKTLPVIILSLFIPVVVFMANQQQNIQQNAATNASGQQIFSDVLPSHPAYDAINSLYEGQVAYGFTQSDGSIRFNPDEIVTRASGAIFLLRAKYGYAKDKTPGDYPNPPPAYFTDGNSAQKPWIDKMYQEGITSGCSNATFCPDEPLRRDDLAVFLLRSFYGRDFVPPTPSLPQNQWFSDVDSSDFRFKYIMFFYENGITTGCGTNRFCPDKAATRSDMAVWITRLYGGWSRKITQQIKNPDAPNNNPTYGDGIHATLLPNQKVLMTGYRRLEKDRSPLPNEDYFQTQWGTSWVFDPATWDGGDSVTTWMERESNVGMKATIGSYPGHPYQELFCAGQTLLSDGRVVYVGGSNRNFAMNNGQYDWSLNGRGVDGIDYSKIYNFTSQTWETAGGAATMIGGRRWYPTTTRMSDGKILITSGFKIYTPGAKRDHNFSVELFNPGTNRYEQYLPTPKYYCPSGSCETDQMMGMVIGSGMYPFVYVLPQGIQTNNTTYSLIGFGDSGVPVLLKYPFDTSSVSDLSRNWFIRSNQRRFGGAATTSTSMLPFRFPESPHYHNGSLLLVGGSAPSTNAALSSLSGREQQASLQENLSPEGEAYTANDAHDMSMMETFSASTVTTGTQIPPYLAASVYDPTGEGTWKYTMNLNSVRTMSSTVILPDSKIFVVHSGYTQNYPNGIDANAAQIIDPLVVKNNSFAVYPGSLHTPEFRGYHSYALLLPDGRVLIGGGAPDGRTAFIEQTNFRFYSPPYMYKQRPAINSMSSITLTYNQTFNVNVTPANSPLGSIEEAVMIALGSHTHSFDMNQRAIQVVLRATDQANQFTVTTPESAQVAPPGHYMLFILDKNRIPSEGKIIQLQQLAPTNTPTPQPSATPTIIPSPTRLPTPTPTTGTLDIDTSPVVGTWGVKLTGTDTYMYTGTGHGVRAVRNGSYVVCFNNVLGYLTPRCKTLIISSGERESYIGEYVKITTGLDITTSPVAGRIYVDNVVKGRGHIIVDLVPGSYQVTVGAEAGYVVPPAQTVTVTQDTLTKRTISYLTPTPLPETPRGVRVNLVQGSVNQYNITWFPVENATYYAVRFSPLTQQNQLSFPTTTMLPVTLKPEIGYKGTVEARIGNPANPSSPTARSSTRTFIGPSPLNLKATCSLVNGQMQGRVEWGAVTGHNYALRVNNTTDPEDGWNPDADTKCASPDGDFCQDFPSTMNPRVKKFNAIPGNTYRVWIHAKNTYTIDGVATDFYSKPASVVFVTCPR